MATRHILTIDGGWIVPPFEWNGRGTGYSIGRSLIGDYLAEHPDARASTLHATSASEFLPSEG